MTPSDTTINNTAVRRAAILVAALDVDAADALLEGLPENAAAQVRAAVMELDEIGADEEQEVIGQFLRLNRPTADAATEAAGVVPSGDDERLPETPISLEEFLLRSSPAPNRQPNENGLPAMRATPDEAAPLAFLKNAREDQLFQALRDESPQTIAVVLSHVAAPQAAALMQRLSPPMQAEVARRLAALDHVPSDTLLELDQCLGQLLAADSLAADPANTGLKALKNILAAAGRGRSELLNNLERKDADLARRLTSDGGGPARLRPAGSTTSTRAASRIEFEDLARLKEADLGRVLQQANGRILLLALAGASPRLMERVYAQLPRADAEALRRQIEQQGTIALRDVEEAQRRIARIAGRLAADGTIEVETARSFAAAA